MFRQCLFQRCLIRRGDDRIEIRPRGDFSKFGCGRMRRRKRHEEQSYENVEGRFHGFAFAWIAVVQAFDWFLRLEPHVIITSIRPTYCFLKTDILRSTVD